jgi:hypothetical protein
MAFLANVIDCYERLAGELGMQNKTMSGCVETRSNGTDTPLTGVIDSLSQIGFELIERLTFLEAIIVRESMRSDFLARASGDLAG